MTANTAVKTVQMASADLRTLTSERTLSTHLCRVVKTPACVQITVQRLAVVTQVFRDFPL